MTNLKIGELAKRAGLSVRALHHYDSIGLLSPSVRTPAGARLYGKPDLIRLHRIQALKQLGCSLSDIRSSLNDEEVAPLALIERQIRALDAQAREARALGKGLRQLASHIVAGGSAAEADWLNVLEMMAIQRHHFTEDELHALRGHEEAAGRDIEARWKELVAEVAQAMQHRLPVASGSAQALAWRWVHLVIAKTGNNASLATKLMAMQRREQRAQEITGIDTAKLAWIGQALAHARVALLAKHLSDAQTAEVRRRQLAGLAHMDEWPQLVAQVRQHMNARRPPEARAVQALAARWQQLFRDSYCGDDPKLEASVREAFAKEPDLRIGVGVDDALMRYMHQAALHHQRTPLLKPTGARHARSRQTTRTLDSA